MNRIAILIVALFVFIGCGGDSGSATTAPQQPTAGKSGVTAGQPGTAGQANGQPIATAGQPVVSAIAGAPNAGQPTNIAGAANICYKQGGRLYNY